MFKKCKIKLTSPTFFKDWKGLRALASQINFKPLPYREFYLRVINKVVFLYLKINPNAAAQNYTEREVITNQELLGAF